MHVVTLFLLMLSVPPQDPKPDELTQDIEKAVTSLGSDNYAAVQDGRAELIEIGGRAVDALVKALREDLKKAEINPATKKPRDPKNSPALRHMICELLGAVRSNRKEVLEVLVAALDDEGEYGTSVASSAAAALGWIADPAVAQALLKALQHKRCDVDKQLKYECIRALGIFRSKEASEALRKALEDKKTTAADQHDDYAHTIAAEAADALGKIRSQEAVDDLGKLLADSTEDKFSGHTLRWHGARALERILQTSKGNLEGDEKDDDGKPTSVQTSIDAWKTWFDTEHKGKKNVAETQVKIKKVHDAILAFKLDEGRLPTSLPELLSKPPDAKNWKGPYLSGEADPTKAFKDAWGFKDLEYRVPGTGADFDVVSLGADGMAWGGGFSADLYDHDQWGAVVQKRNQEKLNAVVQAILKFNEDHKKVPEQFIDLVRKPSYVEPEKWKGPYLGRERYDAVVAAIQKFQEEQKQLPKTLQELKEKNYLQDLNDAYGSPFNYKAPGAAGQPYELSSLGLPKDAFDNSFRYSNKGDPFELISYGADRVEGGTGVDADLKRRKDGE